jgi:hypothetical protein
MGFNPFKAIINGITNIVNVIGGVVEDFIGWLVSPLVPDIPDFDRGDQQAQGALINKQSNNAHIPVIYGTRKVGGVRVFLEVSGNDNQYLYGAIVLSEGEINAITKIYVDDDEVTFNSGFSDGGTVTSNDSRFGSTIQMQTFYGTDGQSASSLLITLDNWTANHKLSGLCYIAFRITWDADKYTGIPKIQALVEGKKVVSYVAIPPNPAENLTLSNTYQSLTNLGSITGRNEDVVFQSDSNGILLKSSYTDAEIWWEAGGTTSGAWLGIAKINDAYFIRFRSGSGKNDQQSTGGGTAGGTNSRAVVNLSVSDSSVASYFDDERHIITWAIEISDATYLAGRLRLWIDGNEVITYDPYNDDGNVLRNGQWAGSDSAGYGQGFSQVAGGDGTFDSGATQYQTFTGTSVGSDVYVFAYENQKITSITSVSYSSQSPAYSSNPAWCLLDYLTNTTYGKGIDVADIDLQSFYNASQTAETQVTPYSGGDDINLFDCNAYIDTSKKLIENVKVLIQGMRGFLPYTQGKYKLIIETTGTASVTLNENNIIGGLKISSEKKNEKYNRVLVDYVSPDHDYQNNTITYPETDAEHQTLKTADDGFLQEGNITLTTITNPYQALEFGEIILERSRNNLTVQCTANYEALDLAIGDIVALDYDLVGFSSKPFRIVGMSINPDFTVGLNLIEHQDSWYTFDEKTQVATLPDTNLPNPFSVEAPSVSHSDELISLFDGSVVSKLTVEVNSNDRFVNEYEVQIKPQGDTNFITIGRSTNKIFEKYPVIEGLTYDIRARSINSLGISSVYTTSRHEVNSAFLPPDDVTGYTVDVVGDKVHHTWLPVGNLDLRFYEIRMSTDTTTTNYADTVVLVERIGRPSTSVVTPYQAGVKYFLKAVDKFGVRSTNYASAIVTEQVFEEKQETTTTITEETAFSGTKTDCVVVDDTLRLDTSINFDSLSGDFDDANGFFDGGGGNIVASGTYDFANDFDFGAKFKFNVHLNSFVVNNLNYVNNFDSKSGLFDTAEGFFDGGENASVSTNVKLYASTSDDAVTYGAYQEFRSGDYNTRAIKFRAVLTSDNVEETPVIENLSLLLSLLKRTETGSNIASGTDVSGKVVTFGYPFYQVPSLTVIAQDMQTGDFFTINSKTASNFNIEFFNSGGTNVSRTFDYQAIGIGQQQ